MTLTTSAPVFDFQADTFAFPNELLWEYHFDPATGRSWTQKRNPPPTYAHHCFVVVRSARQFLRQAAFLPEAPALEEAAYAARIRAVVARPADEAARAQPKIEFPGFASLREFSRAHPALLKDCCGGAWQSYFQRGNWRMVLPFSRAHQDRAVAQVCRSLGEGRLPIIHIATFPSLTINHALMLFAFAETSAGVEFQAYDPNICERPLVLHYDRAARYFQFPRTHYFPGGPVNAYEIYCDAFH
ncbi:MAG TPA: hypothetical protein VHB20_06575 [Verrucomicrobiae bacterium]|jgi:hypothetical protein|nr:hypothetical protein [Verrucomicrobiae bacterium]